MSQYSLDQGAVPVAADDLQFDRAESTASSAGGMTCTVCKRPIADAYYTANGATICGDCRQRLAAQLAVPGGNLLRAVLFGVGAAVAGAVLYFAVAAISGYEIGLVAIAVGWLVGRGIQLGNAGQGSRPYQIIAVTLTYLSVAGAYFALAVRGVAGGWPLGGLQQIALLIGLPIMSAVGNLPGGLISLFILFIGLHQAWRMTGRVSIDLLGPFAVRRPAEPETPA
jgi:hypothetical protein